MSLVSSFTQLLLLSLVDLRSTSVFVTMGSAFSKQHQTAGDKAQQDKERRDKERLDLLYRKGVLIPPSFGTSTDAIPPPSSTSSAGISCTTASPSSSTGASSSSSQLGLGVISSAPHLVLSSHVLGLGPVGGSASGASSIIASHLARLSSYRLLSPEHLLCGLFVSASTPSGLGNAAAGWAAPGGVGGGSGSSGDTGFLSGAVLLPAGYSSSSSSSSLSALSGIGGAVSTSSSTSDLAGHLGAFISRPLGSGEGQGSADGQLTGYAYAAASEPGGTPGTVGNASAPTSADAESNNISQGTAMSMAKLGWSYSRRLLPSSGNDWPSTEYYRNDPFARKTKPTQNGRGSAPQIGIGSSLMFIPRSEGVEVKLASSHMTVSAPSNGIEGAVEASVPVNASARKSNGDGDIFDFFSRPSDSTIDATALVDTIKTLKPNVSGYVSFDLNQVGGGGGSYDPSDDEAQGPPIMVTLHKLKSDKNSEAAATVSQTFTFDRIVTNPLEDRCPKIRNTVSWAVRLRRSVLSVAGYGPVDMDMDDGKNTAATRSADSGGPSTASTALTAAIAYQVNRGLCYKVQADSKEGVTVGILLKRWAHPRITASILFGTKGSSGSVPIGAQTIGVGFKGICLQVESGPLPSSAPADPPGTVPASQFVNGDWLYGLAGAKGGAGVAGETPATRAEVPDK